MLGVELLAREGAHQLVAAHADVAVGPPHRQHLAALQERPVPRERVVVVRVDERAVDVEDRGGLAAHAGANSSTILAQNAGRSSGLREDTRPSSTTTSSSTHVPPALRMSVCSDGHEVIVRPCSTSASTRVHGAWQIAATGLPASKKLRTNETASACMRRLSGFATPPGSIRAS